MMTGTMMMQYYSPSLFESMNKWYMILYDMIYLLVSNESSSSSTARVTTPMHSTIWKCAQFLCSPYCGVALCTASRSLHSAPNHSVCCFGCPLLALLISWLLQALWLWLWLSWMYTCLSKMKGRLCTFCAERKRLEGKYVTSSSSSVIFSLFPTSRVKWATHIRHLPRTLGRMPTAQETFLFLQLFLISLSLFILYILNKKNWETHAHKE